MPAASMAASMEHGQAQAPGLAILLPSLLFAAGSRQPVHAGPGCSSEAGLTAGKSVSKYIGNRSPRNSQIVALGVDAYLKMLLHDNFVHTDLHPGNILVSCPATAAEAVQQHCLFSWKVKSPVDDSLL